jgi:hypothetical protein
LPAFVVTRKEIGCLLNCGSRVPGRPTSWRRTPATAALRKRRGVGVVNRGGPRVRLIIALRGAHLRVCMHRACDPTRFVPSLPELHLPQLSSLAVFSFMPALTRAASRRWEQSNSVATTQRDGQQLSTHPMLTGQTMAMNACAGHGQLTDAQL